MPNLKNNIKLKYIDGEYLEKIIDPFLNNYNNHIVYLILNINVRKDRVLDFGASFGTIAKIIKKKKIINPICIEIDQYFISVLKKIILRLLMIYVKQKYDLKIISSFRKFLYQPI